MGTWGTGIFDSDLACDLRNAYRDLVGDGAAAASKRIQRDWAGGFGDPEDGPVLLLALAEAQWDAGRVDAKVRARALKLIEKGGAAGDFSGELAAKRARELARLHKKLA